MSPYEAWIEAYVSRQPKRFVRGLCEEASKEMVEAFPELKRVCGFVHTPNGKEEHWWCVTADGKVVDPTASQFSVVFEYEILVLKRTADRNRVPVGRCLDCGDSTYFNSYSHDFCNEACVQSFEADLLA